MEVLRNKASDILDKRVSFETLDSLSTQGGYALQKYLEEKLCPIAYYLNTDGPSYFQMEVLEQESRYSKYCEYVFEVYSSYDLLHQLFKYVEMNEKELYEAITDLHKYAVMKHRNGEMLELNSDIETDINLGTLSENETDISIGTIIALMESALIEPVVHRAFMPFSMKHLYIAGENLRSVV